MKVKGGSVTFYSKSGGKVAVHDASPEVKARLVGLEVRFDTKSALYRALIDGEAVYLSSKDIKVKHGVGRSSAQICAEVKDVGVRKGSSGSGASCN